MAEQFFAKMHGQKALCTIPVDNTKAEGWTLFNKLAKLLSAEVWLVG